MICLKIYDIIQKFLYHRQYFFKKRRSSMFGTQKISQCRRILAVLIFTLLTASVSCTSDKGGSSAPPTIPSSAATIPPLSVSPSQSVPTPDPDLPDRIGLYIDDG